MSSDEEKRKTSQALRAIFLRHNAAHFTYGVLSYAKTAVGNRTVPQLLREIADKGALTPDERAFLHQLLLAIADGRDVREELRIDAPKIGHNPPQGALNADILFELHRCTLDGQCTKNGRPNAKAIANVARLTGKSIGAVRKIWERAEGGISGQ